MQVENEIIVKMPILGKKLLTSQEKKEYNYRVEKQKIFM